MSDVIDAKKLMKIGMRGYKDTIDVNWHGVIIHIKYLLSRDDEYRLVRTIVNCCTTSDGVFVPDMFELAKRACIVSAYSSVILPEDIDEQHKLLYYSNLFDVVKENANTCQINNIISLISPY